jgi:hypothetical protein
MDFSKAGPQNVEDDDASTLPPNVISFAHAAAQREWPSDADREQRKENIKNELNARAEEVLQSLFPAGKIVNGVFEIGDVYGSPGKSLKVSLKGDKRGLWKDFESGQGGDMIALWQAYSGVDFPTALNEIEKYLGGGGRSTPTKTPDYHLTPQEKPKKDPPMSPGLPVATWQYRDAEGNIIAQVTRYDDIQQDGTVNKEFRPWDVTTKKHQAPDPRPLYNQPGIKNAGTVVLVEGEKCAKALSQYGIAATTAMNGSNAPVEKTDWSPLQGKDVIVWPDNDDAGRAYAYRVAEYIKSTAKSIRVLAIPPDKPPKWDASDAIDEGFDVTTFVLHPAPTVPFTPVPPPLPAPTSPGITLTNWKADLLFRGDPPVRKWLVDRTFPMASVGILAALGDAGKGMLTLDLALKVTADWSDCSLINPPMAFGNLVKEFGSAVILTAEDDLDEVHRRIKGIDRYNKLSSTNGRLMVVPLPNAGGTFPLIECGKNNNPTATNDFIELRRQLLEIPDLKLVVIDPLASFVSADINADPAVGAFTTGLLASLATETGAFTLTCHHMAKGNGTAAQKIKSPEQARAAIRGTTALVDGVRLAYSLWPVDNDYAKDVCKKLQIVFHYGCVFKGAVVKANGPADKEPKTYLRRENGLLEVVDEQLKAMRTSKDILKELLTADIASKAEDGQPFTTSGLSGIHELKHTLSIELQSLGKHTLQEMVKELIDEGAVCKCYFKGNTAKWLDVPFGPIWLGSDDAIPRGAVSPAKEKKA